jgi:hypothetical protein
MHSIRKRDSYAYIPMNAITEDLHLSENTRHSSQLVRSWQICFVIEVIITLIFFTMF